MLLVRRAPWVPRVLPVRRVFPVLPGSPVPPARLVLRGVRVLPVPLALRVRPAPWG